MKDINRAGVYVILNIVNDKVYVGSTTRSFRRRWNDHKRDLRLGKHCNKHLQRSWEKYGEAAFRFEILEFTDSKDVLEKEQEAIDAFQSFDLNFGYNNCPVAGNSMGCIATDEAKEIMSQRRKEYLLRHPEFNSWMSSEKQKLYAECPEVREQISQSLKRYYEAHPEAMDNWRTKIAEYWRDGSKRREMSDKKKQFYVDNPSARKKASQVSLEKWNDPEYRKRVSDARLQLMKDRPELRERQREAAKAMWKNPEYVAKRAATVAANREARKRLKDLGGIQ